MRLPTLRQLQYFVSVANTLSFSRAAEICHITQPSLSFALTELEENLGEKLFHRGTRKMELSQVGEEVLPIARDILEQAEFFVRTAQRNRAPLSGKLSLGVIPTIAPYLLPKLLPALQTTYPLLDLQLKEDITGRQLDALKQGQIDVILMAMPYETPNMEQFILWAEPFFLARPGEHGSVGEVALLGDLDQENVLLLDDGHCIRDHIMSACRIGASGMNRKTLGATSLQTLIQMVQNGYGVTLLPAMAIDPNNMPNGITLQRFPPPMPTRKIGLVWRKGDPRAEEFRLLGGFIKQISYIERK